MSRSGAQGRFCFQSGRYHLLLEEKAGMVIAHYEQFGFPELRLAHL